MFVQSQASIRVVLRTLVSAVGTDRPRWLAQVLTEVERQGGVLSGALSLDTGSVASVLAGRSRIVELGLELRRSVALPAELATPRSADGGHGVSPQQLANYEMVQRLARDAGAEIVLKALVPDRNRFRSDEACVHSVEQGLAEVLFGAGFDLLAASSSRPNSGRTVSATFVARRYVADSLQTQIATLHHHAQSLLRDHCDPSDPTSRLAFATIEDLTRHEDAWNRTVSLQI